MSEGDVSLIRDEDVLRRMWQQTEDFSRKKEIRAHMYKLREERLRDLYSPEPTFGKGGDLTGAQSHVRSLADQSFQSIKSKEVRDAASPTKEFYRGQDLKDLSNAGWNVESENRTTNDGHTHVRAVHANIEGRYDIDGGKGQFAAVDSHKQAVTEYQDENTSLKRNESSSNTAAHEQTFRKTEDGTQFSTSTSKSSNSSKYEQKSTKYETVPYKNDQINTKNLINITNKNEENNIRDESSYKDVKISKTSGYENNLRETNQGELIAKKVEYPDENTKVVVETRRLSDGSKVTSTRREFQAPTVHTSRSEHHSESNHVAQNENSYTSQNIRQSKVTHESDQHTKDIVESQKISDDYDFKRNHTYNRRDESNIKSEHHLNVDNVDRNDIYISSKDESKQYTDHKNNRDDVYVKKSVIKTDEQHIHNNQKEFRKKIDNNYSIDEPKNNTSNKVNENINKEKIVYVDTRNKKTEFQSKKEKTIKESKTESDDYQTTYQSDYTQKKISNDWSPSHQAWASTLRADSPTKPATRGSSPASSMRSSVSPDKSRKPTSRSESPSKIDRQSPSRGYSNRHTSSTQSTVETKTSQYTSPDSPAHHRPRLSASPDKRMRDECRQSISPEKRFYENPIDKNEFYRSPSPEKKPNKEKYSSVPSQSHDIKSTNKASNYVSSTKQTKITTMRSSPDHKVHPRDDSPVNEDDIPSYMKPTASSILNSNLDEKTHTHYRSTTDRQSPSLSKIKEDHYTLIDEETKMYTRNEERKASPSPYEKSPSPSRKPYGYHSRPDKPSTLGRPSSIKNSRSPSPPKGTVSFTDSYDQVDKCDSYKSSTFEKQINDYTSKTTTRENVSPTRGTLPHYKYRPDNEPTDSARESSPSKFNTYDKNTKSSRKVDEFSTTTTHEDSKYDTLTKSSTVQKNKPSRDITSPSKPNTDTKYQHTTDFLASERTFEEVNKKHAMGHPRQLLTPSSSPTRQPKADDTAPSTGQSSPTTSVSGFVYYGSPKQEPVTNLDDQDFYSEIKNISYQQRPDFLEVKPTTPSKKPCKSPSPDKVVSPTKEKLPRKSSLKKPTVDIESVSPSEKPPSSFCVSPTEDGPTQHKIVKKDRPDKPESEFTKTKAPLERRETYEERCMKILGIIDDKTQRNKPESNSTSPSISPVLSSRQDSPSKDTIYSSVTKKRDDIITSTATKKSSKTPSRESSPTKLQDIDITVRSDIRKKETEKYPSPKPSISPERKSPEHTKQTYKKPDNELTDTKKQPQRNSSPTKKLETPMHSRTPSPIKKVTAISENSNDFIITEREHQILEKVQRSLRKLSPDRNERSPSREQSPTKFSLTKSVQEEKTTKSETLTRQINEKQDVVKGTKKNIITETSKPLSRNVSPTKKPVKLDKSQESPNSQRSLSPKKNVSSPVRSQLPQIVKSTTAKPREPISPSPKPVSLNKTEKVETRKSSISKSNSFSKTVSKTNSNSSMSTTKTENIERRTQVSPKGNKENVSPKKEDTKVTRTVSDFLIKKKPSPQRIKSKPEIQVSNLNSMKPAKSPITRSTQKPRDQISRFNIKKSETKSETTLNTHVDDDDEVIVDDVEHAKSSRENSPDRICPTPVGYLDDVGTPRLPDEVSEPDDDFRKRTHQTIHETESIVDDIVEISEDDELFDKRDSNKVTASDECLLSVNDKVSKFNQKIQNIGKPKEATGLFEDTEIKVHSDFVDQEIKPDECLLTVSEKVDKFIKESLDVEDKKSSSRKIVDEYDNDTIYQDDYTKLSVNDKAHLFIETAENVKSTKPSQKFERLDLTDVDESLKSDECLLSVSAKVNKFVKTAEQFLNETRKSEENERMIKEKHENILKKIIQNDDYIVEQDKEKISMNRNTEKIKEDQEELSSFAKETASSHAKNKDYISPNLKPSDKIAPVKITTLRSSEAVKKAKALFENIASTGQTTTCKTSTAKLTDIGVIRKSPRTDSTIVHHPSLDDGFPRSDREIDSLTKSDRLSSCALTRPLVKPKEKSQTPEVRTKSPIRHTVETATTKSVHSKYPVGQREAPKVKEPEKPQDIMSQPRHTKPSQATDDTRVEEIEVSTRRGSGKFGVELRRTSLEKSTLVSERRRSSTERHQPCIEDIFDLNLLEQMLENITGYEQRRRIRAQIRLVKKKTETERIDTGTYTKTTKINRSPEPLKTTSPERLTKTQKTVSPDRSKKPYLNGHAKEPVEKRPRPQSPEKPTLTKTTKSPVRQPSPEKKLRTQSPSKTSVTKPKTNRFDEYASAYMKKVGLSGADKLKLTKSKYENETQEFIKQERRESSETITSSVIKNTSENQFSRDTKTFQVNGHRRTSPEKKRSPERKAQTPSDRLYYRSPSPDFKKPRSEAMTRETTIKAVYDIDKKVKPKTTQEEKPDWVTNRSLKKISSETRTSSTKKMETEKQKSRATSPSKVISKPIDVITSSYGIGPLDADGKPLFGIKALRNGANIQVKGTIVREEYHSRNGGEPEGSISVTTYSTQPEELEKLLKDQSDRPSRIHGLAAITTTKKFGGDTGTTLRESRTKEERASLDRFTHSDRKVDSRIGSSIDHRQEQTKGVGHRQERIREDTQPKREERIHREEKTESVGRREDKKMVKQSSVKSLTEKYIKSTSEGSRSDRTSYPKAGLILRTTNRKDSDTGLIRTDSDHSLDTTEENVTTTTKTTEEGGRRTTSTTTTSTRSGSSRTQERSFLDSTTKVSGVQDILSRMKNADIVIEDGDTNEDTEARALLNKFLGATVLMAGMQGYVSEQPTGKLKIKQETVRSSSSGGSKVTKSIQEIDLDQCWDERSLRKLLEECTDYEQRRQIRGRIRSLMAEQEACASAVSEAVAGLGDGSPTDEREETEVTVTASARRDSSEKKTTTTTTTVQSSKVIENVRAAPKPVSPFTKFRQLEKQNSVNSPSSPGSPTSLGPYFKFTDPALQASAATIKERLLQWCRDKTRDYENVKLENFSTSWADGLAFCALVHHFLPNAFDYSKLTPEKRRHNFTLAFKVADEKAGIYPLLDVDDMVAMRKPDWKCVFTYVQAIHRRFKDEP